MIRKLNPYDPPTGVSASEGRQTRSERMRCPECDHVESFLSHYVKPGSTTCSNCAAPINHRLPGSLRQFDWHAIALLTTGMILCGYLAPSILLETTVCVWFIILAADVILNVCLGYLELARPSRDR